MLPRRNKQNDTSMCGCVRGNYFSLHEKVNVLSLHILIELLYVLKKKGDKATFENFKNFAFVNDMFKS
jgi:hypothetical protein